MKKRMITLALISVMTMAMVACSGSTESETEEAVDLGTSMEVLDAIYETAELDSDLEDQIVNGGFQQAELDESIEAMFIGEAEVAYVDGAVSAPLMSSIAYQVVVLQLEDGQDVEAAKTELLDAADTGKWVCVEPEAVVAESNGNYILFIMADTETTNALVEVFQSL